MSELHCEACGAQGKSNPDCSCGKGYTYMSASKAAALAVAKNPKWSDARLAEATGVSDKTIAAARLKSGSENSDPEKRTGRNGKEQAGRQNKRKFSQEVRDAAASAVLDEGLTHTEVQAKFGMSAPVLRAAVEGLRREREEKERTKAEYAPPTEPAPPPKLSKSDAAAMKAYQRELDAKFEERVLGDIKWRVETMVLPRLREKEEHAERVRKSRKGIFTQAEYNVILKCVHADVKRPLPEVMNEAFRLWRENRLVLMSEKEDPQPQVRAVPTVEEFMRGYPWKGKA